MAKEAKHRTMLPLSGGGFHKAALSMEAIFERNLWVGNRSNGPLRPKLKCWLVSGLDAIGFDFAASGAERPTKGTRCAHTLWRSARPKNPEKPCDRILWHMYGAKYAPHRGSILFGRPAHQAATSLFPKALEVSRDRGEFSPSHRRLDMLGCAATFQPPLAPWHI